MLRNAANVPFSHNNDISSVQDDCTDCEQNWHTKQIDPEQVNICRCYVYVFIEQVTYFKYLGCCISEYKSDLEDKLQTYNKIDGAIRRHFGKKMDKETKLRIHNITAKATLKFGSEAWVLKKREEQRLEAAQMKFLRHLLGITKLDKEKN